MAEVGRGRGLRSTVPICRYLCTYRFLYVDSCVIIAGGCMYICFSSSMAASRPNWFLCIHTIIDMALTGSGLELSPPTPYTLGRY